MSCDTASSASGIVARWYHMLQVGGTNHDYIIRHYDICSTKVAPIGTEKIKASCLALRWQ